MDHSSALLNFSEIALALGGFTAIVVALSSRSDGNWDMNRITVGSLLLTIFSAATIPIVCIALLNFEVAEQSAWTAGSSLQVAVNVFFLGVVVPKAFKSKLRSRLSWLILPITAANFLFQAANIFGAFATQGFAVMFAGLAWFFVAGAMGLARELLERTNTVSP